MEEEKIKKGKQKVKSVKKKDSTGKKENHVHDEKLTLENAKLNEKVLRLMAEMQNIKRRNDEEISRLCKYDGEKLILKLLPIVDNFERAISLDDRDLSDEVSKFLSGFKIIYSKLVNLLNNFEVKEIDTLNKEFDPAFHQAVMTKKIENVKTGTVIDVLQKGYMYKDRVIRPSMVIVAE